MSSNELENRLNKYMKDDCTYDLYAIRRDEGMDEFTASFFGIFDSVDDDGFEREERSELLQAAIEHNETIYAIRAREREANMVSVKIVLLDETESPDQRDDDFIVVTRRMPRAEYEEMMRKQAERDAEYEAMCAKAQERSQRVEELFQTCPIKSINTWHSEKKEWRVYVNLRNGKYLCYYLTGNKYHPAGTWEGPVTPELITMTKQLALYEDEDGTGKKRWHSVRENEMKDALYRLV